MIAQLQSTALAGAEVAINRALQYDPATGNRLNEMGPCTLCVELTSPAVVIYLVSHNGQIQLHSESETEPDVRVKGSASDLIAMALSDDDTLAGRGVEVRGQLDRLQALKTILGDLDIDWEGALAELIGELPAHLAIKAARSAHQWQQQARPRAAAVAKNFIQDEALLIPAKEQVASFGAAVRTLSSDMDRLAARIRRLQQQVAERSIVEPSTDQPSKDA
ncbi:SCP2 sterol-binding domain-containing protein [bacterium SCSIO 12696]|nr:SCP2 sterol-binding domain-containing protein [bacterium SCSIO 12696]